MRGADTAVEEVSETPTTPEEIAATKSEIVPESVTEVTPEVATPAPTTDDDIPDWLRGASEESPDISGEEKTTTEEKPIEQIASDEIPVPAP